MHLSIFNSSFRSSWTISILMSVILGVACLGLLEITWRKQGHEPSVIDDKDLWSVQRRVASTRKENVLVLLGASRMHANVDPQVLKALLPGYSVAQLAVNGAHPLATLRDLSNDASFRGLVLCSIVAPGFERRHWDDQQPYVDYFRNEFRFNERINRKLATFFQSRLAILEAHLNLKTVLIRYFETGKWPANKYVTTYGDRHRCVDYSKANIEKSKKSRIDGLVRYYKKYPPPTPESWLEEALETEKWTEKIRKRGGAVVYIRFPTTGEYWTIDEQFYPRNLYWERFSAATVAKTIHFKDVPILSSFYLPDTSHLDCKDSPTFTGALLDVLFKEGMAPSI